MRVAALILFFSSLSVFAQSGDVVVRQVTQITHDNGTNIDEVSGSVSVTYNCYGTCYFGSGTYSSGYTGSFGYAASQRPDGSLEVPGIAVGAAWSKASTGWPSGLINAVYTPPTPDSTISLRLSTDPANSNSFYVPVGSNIDTGVHLTNGLYMPVNLSSSPVADGLTSLQSASAMKGFGLSGSPAFTGLDVNTLSASNDDYMKGLLDRSNWGTHSTTVKSIYEETALLIGSQEAPSDNSGAQPWLSLTGTPAGNSIPTTIGSRLYSSVSTAGIWGGTGLTNLVIPTNILSGIGQESLTQEIESLKSVGKQVVSWTVITEQVPTTN
jgi:hypothetical protein